MSNNQDKQLAIDVHNLKKSFNGKIAVADVSLKVYKGEIFGFMGPNGGGKTTTIRMLCGILTPDAGNGTCLGYDILTQSQEIKNIIGYMTQQFSLYEELTVRENLNFMAHLYGIKNYKEIVELKIQELGLTDRANQIVRTLSGGWKQRLSLSAALLHSPQLLLLDEPTAGVDPKARKEFWDQIQQLASNGVTTLVSTHYMDEAERCNRLAYISQGLILSSGTKNEIIKNSQLITWEVMDDNIKELMPTLKALPYVEQITLYENTLHVTSSDPENLLKSIAPYQVAPYQWRQITPNLEDVFIYLVGNHRGAKKDEI